MFRCGLYAREGTDPRNGERAPSQRTARKGTDPKNGEIGHRSKERRDRAPTQRTARKGTAPKNGEIGTDPKNGTRHTSHNKLLKEDNSKVDQNNKEQSPQWTGPRKIASHQRDSKGESEVK